MTQNITFSTEAEQIKQMRELARSRGKTFNDLFREWVKESTQAEEAKKRAKHVKAMKESFKKINYVKLDRKYTREEMNER